MTTPFWCLIVTTLIPYVIAGLGVRFRVQQLGNLDVAEPRLQANELTGTAARAIHAQSNAWEAVSVFGVAVVVAHLAGADAETSAIAAIVFVVARILHAVFYIGDRPPLRTASFLVGMLCCLTLFGLAISA